MTGIYQIRSISHPERIYIGSSVDIQKRWRKHRSGLKNYKHENARLQNHYNKYGESDLVFSLIICCNKENLISFEQFYIDSLNPYFNIRKIAESNLGTKRTDQQKRKLSMSQKGIRRSQQFKDKISILKMGNKNNLGHIHSEASKEKMRIGAIGRHMSTESRNKMSKNHNITSTFKGHNHSEISKLKMSLAKKGKPSLKKGIKLSEEARQHIKEAAIKTWQLRKNINHDNG